MDVIVHSDDVRQRCLFFLTDVDIPTVLGVSFLGEEIIVGISYFGVVAYQFKKTFEFLYLVVSYGGFGLVRVDAIVERLDGYISRNSEDGAFTTEILLPQE